MWSGVEQSAIGDRQGKSAGETLFDGNIKLLSLAVIPTVWVWSLSGSAQKNETHPTRSKIGSVFS